MEVGGRMGIIGDSARGERSVDIYSVSVIPIFKTGRVIDDGWF